VPQGLPKTAPEDPAAIWKTAKVTFKKTAQDKVGTEVAATAFVAFLPAALKNSRACAWTKPRSRSSAARASPSLHRLN
jgi:hypothetical protein